MRRSRPRHILCLQALDGGARANNVWFASMRRAMSGATANGVCRAVKLFGLRDWAPGPASQPADIGMSSDYSMPDSLLSSMLDTFTLPGEGDMTTRSDPESIEKPPEGAE
eukprot:9248144-Pyramimonas_sp.AAC.1